MGTVNWREPDNLKRLLTASDDDLRQYYYWIEWEALKRTRRKYRAKFREIQMEKPKNRQEQEPTELDKLAQIFQEAGLNIEATDLEGASRAGFHVGFIRNAEGEIEYTKPLPNVSFIPKSNNEVYEPVEPAKITPTKRKKIQRLSSFILAYGDGQVDYRRIIDPITEEQKLIPLHNEAMHRIIQQINARYRPDTTVNLGDFADMSALSKFEKDSDHFHKTLGPSMRYIHDFYAQLVSDNPDGHHVEVDSNHAVRVKNQVLRNIPALHDYVRPGETYPMMTYYYLANLGRLGIDFISGYGNAEFVYGEKKGIPIVFKHGTHSSGAPGATARKEAQENPEVHIMRGHSHSDQHVSLTDRQGRRHFYYVLGSSCINNGPVPGYHSSIDDHNQPVQYHNRGHQNTFSLIEDFGNGEYQVDIINVINGKAYFRGEVFDGNI